MRRASSSKFVEAGRTTYQDDNPLAALLGDTQSAASAAIAAAQAAIAAVSVAETAQTQSNALLDLWTTEATQTAAVVEAFEDPNVTAESAAATVEAAQETFAAADKVVDDALVTATQAISTQNAVEEALAAPAAAEAAAQGEEGQEALAQL